MTTHQIIYFLEQGFRLALVLAILIALWDRPRATLPKAKFLCKYMNWHKPPGLKDAIFHKHCDAIIGHWCPRCGSKILQDSNGDWFSVAD